MQSKLKESQMIEESLEIEPAYELSKRPQKQPGFQLEMFLYRHRRQTKAVRRGIHSRKHENFGVVDVHSEKGLSLTQNGWTARQSVLPNVSTRTGHSDGRSSSKTRRGDVETVDVHKRSRRI